ncbi:hypothetical protein CPB83DRAFT_115159 [Crepidotus variabilis]|uniref:Uncharacterized protein n=1 Tax=Crepidotus variabilis TaxID=179855 RepID=A0A9P6E4F9_9AGAR|nr:hypothetical protein CPB83DRAFT_115159 [Crepidotus variabilis]
MVNIIRPAKSVRDWDDNELLGFNIITVLKMSMSPHFSALRVRNCLRLTFLKSFSTT